MSEANSQVAILGWGRMGGAIGRRLVDAGLSVAMYDPSPAARKHAADYGAAVAGSVADALRGAKYLVTVLPDADAVELAAAGPDGILAAVGPGTIWLEMSSSLPAVTRELAVTVEPLGVRLLDAPVTGGVPKAVAGKLTVIAAGTSETLAEAEPVLRHLAAHVFHVGFAPGMGDLVKTVNNLISAANLVIAAEGLAIAQRCGVDLARVLDVLNAGTGQSNATSWKIPQYVLTETFDSQFSIGQYVKDLGIALRVAEESGLRLPMAEAAAAIWREWVSDGLGERDHTEAARLVMERVGGQR